MRSGAGLLVALVLAAAASPASKPDEIAKRLAVRAQGQTPLIDDVRELCDRVGGRPTGSPACSRAVKWAADKLRATGVDKVTVERFAMPRLWLARSAEASCTAPEHFGLRVAAAPGSASTPRPLEARLVVAQADQLSQLPSARGAVLLILSKEMKTLDDLFDEYMRNRPLLEAARKAQVAAVLLQSTRPRGLLYRHPVTLAGEVAPLPVAVVAREHAARLARLAGQGQVRVRLQLTNQIGGAYQAENVVAEIRGRERPDEIVLLGAHLDSWDLGTGAEDNGVNAALVIDVARGLAAVGQRPRRTVRLVLFTGEEQGMLGSAGYVGRHAAEIAGHVAVVVFDLGSGRTLGFYTNGRDELRQPVDELLAAGGLEARAHLPDALDGTDNFDFLLSGVPNLVANQDPAPYLPEYHAESDVFERVNLAQAKHNDAIAAVLVWGLAERTQRLAPRQTRAELDQLIRKTKLDEQMKAFGQWEAWMAGKRAVPPP